MTDLAQGYHAKLLLPAGRVLRVGSPGTANVKPDGASLVVVAATTTDFGPSATPTRYRIDAASGRCSYEIVRRDMREVVVAASVPSNNDGRDNGTVYLPS